jgi:hypothetical protein
VLGAGAGGGGEGGAGGGEGGAAASSSAAAAAAAAAGRVAVRWAPVEDLETELFTVRPGEVKVRPRRGRARSAGPAPHAAYLGASVLSGAAASSAVGTNRSLAGWTPRAPWWTPCPHRALPLPRRRPQAARYESADDRARAAAAAGADAEARRRAAADDAAARALRDMMGGRLARAADEVADLAAARPAWMDGSPQARRWGVWAAD